MDSTPRPVLLGVRQGSVFRPLSFNIVIAALPKVLPPSQQFQHGICNYLETRVIQNVLQEALSTFLSFIGGYRPFRLANENSRHVIKDPAMFLPFEWMSLS